MEHNNMTSPVRERVRKETAKKKKDADDEGARSRGKSRGGS